MIRVTTKTLLEEPRAELTTLHTLRLLPASGLIDEVPCLMMPYLVIPKTLKPSHPAKSCSMMSLLQPQACACSACLACCLSWLHAAACLGRGFTDCLLGDRLWVPLHCFQSSVLVSWACLGRCGRFSVQHSVQDLYQCVCAGAPVQAGVADAVASFMLQDLRRFQMYDSSATRPYTISAIANYKRAAHLGYIALDPAGKARPCRRLCG